MELQRIDIGKLVPFKGNVRKRYDKQAMAMLVESIKQVAKQAGTNLPEDGILQPLIVREGEALNTFEVVAGSRRLAAMKSLGAKVVPCTVRNLSDDAAERVSAMENLQRMDLHPLEEAAEYVRLRQVGDTVPEIAKACNRTERHVAERLQLTTLHRDISASYWLGQMPQWMRLGHLLEICKLPSQDDQKRLYENLTYEVTVEGLRTHIISQFMHSLDRAPFPLAKAIGEFGACNKCAKRTDAQRAMFQDYNPHDEVKRCLDSACWNAKAETHAAELIDSGKPVVESSNVADERFVPLHFFSFDVAKGLPTEEVVVVGENEYNRNQVVKMVSRELLTEEQAADLKDVTEDGRRRGGSASEAERRVSKQERDDIVAMSKVIAAGAPVLALPVLRAVWDSMQKASSAGNRKEWLARMDKDTKSHLADLPDLPADDQSASFWFWLLAVILAAEPYGDRRQSIKNMHAFVKLLDPQVSGAALDQAEMIYSTWFGKNGQPLKDGVANYKKRLGGDAIADANKRAKASGKASKTKGKSK